MLRDTTLVFADEFLRLILLPPLLLLPFEGLLSITVFVLLTECDADGVVGALLSLLQSLVMFGSELPEVPLSSLLTHFAVEDGGGGGGGLNGFVTVALTGVPLSMHSLPLLSSLLGGGGGCRIDRFCVLGACLAWNELPDLLYSYSSSMSLRLTPLSV